MGIEEQKEELEVLDSIYDGDGKFRRLHDDVFQYQCGEEGDPKAFIVQVKWGPNYPEESPEISMEVFFNQHLIPPVKAAIKAEAEKIAEDNLGMAMTYTIFEFVKDAAPKLTADQPLAPAVTKLEEDVKVLSLEDEKNQASSKTKKQPTMSKAQKRKAFDRLGAKGELPRGWNWVDIVKHLSQTGKS